MKKDGIRRGIVSLKIPNFSEFRFLSEAFLAQKIPPVVLDGPVLYIHKTWVYLLAVSVFRTEKLNIFCWDAKRLRYFEELNKKRKKKRLKHRLTYRSARRLVEEHTPYSLVYEKMGACKFIDSVIDKCIAYKTLKRMLFYFRRIPGGEKMAGKIYEYICKNYPKVELLYPARGLRKGRRRIIQRNNTYSGVMSKKEFEDLKKRHRFSNSRYLEGIFDSEDDYKESIFLEAKIKQADSYYEEGVSELQEVKKEADWRNLLLYREFSPENIG